MSDEEYSSDDSNDEEDSAHENHNNNNNNKSKQPRELSIADNDDDYDMSALQRPDLATINAEDDGEDEGEDDDFGEMSDEEQSRNRKPSLTKKSKSKVNDRSIISRADSEDKKNKKKKKKQLFICLTATKYDCVRRVAKKLNFKEVGDDEDWTLYWTDTSVSIDRVNQMKRWQKINHFPGMSEICRKDFLTRNMNRMAKLFPKDYSFYPKAWCLPADYADLSNYARLKKNKTYICKPDSGCQGRGIFITKNPFKDIKPGDNYVAQVYVSRPFVIDGYKFDLRVYVAVTSCDPFRIFVYKEGLARFTTQQYEEPTQNNCKDVFMHLTNYAIQKRSDDFIRDEDTGTKRRISTINKWLRDKGYDIDKMWSDIDDVVIKTIISAHSVLKHSYRTCFANHFRGSACFEILGFDILLDKKLKPYVLEVNHSPSFTTDSKLDREIKDALIYDTIMLLNMGVSDKKRCIEEERKRVRDRLFLRQGKRETKEELEDIQQQWLQQIEKWENKHIGNYRRIYPGPGSNEKYDKFFNNSGTLFSETAASKARLEQAKQQMEEIQRKNEKIIGSKNYKNNNKELRGESPGRKPSLNTSTNKTTTRLQSRNSNGQNGSQNYSSHSRYRSQQATLFLTSTNEDSSNNISSRAMSANRLLKLSSNDTSNPSVRVGTPIDSMKPLAIDEAEELERIQLMKQRENLIKGMGINEFVHRILFGTPGTVATVPPPINNAAQANNINAHNAALLANTNMMAYQPNMQQLNQYYQQQQLQIQQQQSQDTLHTKYISSSSIYNNNNNFNTYSSSKLEIKARNYNPFENHNQFLNEKLASLNNQTNNKNNNIINTLNTNTIKAKIIQNNLNINAISLNALAKQQKDLLNTSNSNNLNGYSNSLNGNLRVSNNNSSNNSNINANNTRYSAGTGNSTSHINQYQNPNFNNYLMNPPGYENTNANLNTSDLLQINQPQQQQQQQKKLSARLTDVQKTESLNNSLFNNYRVRSAQNVAKQRATGVYIFSYHIPTIKAAVSYQVMHPQALLDSSQTNSLNKFNSNSTINILHSNSAANIREKNK